MKTTPDCFIYSDKCRDFDKQGRSAAVAAAARGNSPELKLSLR